MTVEGDRIDWTTTSRDQNKRGYRRSEIVDRLTLLLRLDTTYFKNTQAKNLAGNDLTMNRIMGNANDLVRGLSEKPRIAVALAVILYVLLWGVLNMIDFSLGTMYKWLTLALQSPESQLGAGLGGTVGVVIGITYSWPWTAVILGIGVGALLGGCFCSGSYKLLFGHRRRQARQRQNRLRSP